MSIKIKTGKGNNRVTTTVKVKAPNEAAVKRILEHPTLKTLVAVFEDRHGFGGQEVSEKKDKLYSYEILQVKSDVELRTKFVKWLIKQLMLSELVIFDFDGTLLHLDINWEEVKRKIIRKVEVTGVIVTDEVKNMQVAHAANYLSQDGHRDIVVETSMEAEENCMQRNGITIFPKMIELIRKLKEEGYLVAIASGNTTPTIKEILSSQNIAPDFIAGRDSVSVSKPYPDVLNLVLKHLDMKNEKAIFVGNSEEFDGGSGINAKMKTIVVRPNDEVDIEMLHSLLL